MASTQAERLRLVQTVGIVFALLNFMFILFKFIRKLRESDSKAEQAQRETAEILGTVGEGLFLIDRNMIVGVQQSASLSGLLGTALPPGSDFAAVLRGMVKGDDHSLAVDYIRLLLGDRVKESLVRDLNPLRELSVETSEGPRNLSFSFNRVMVEGQLSHLLVTVSDVTELVRTRAELAASQGQADQQLSALLELARMQPAELSRFISTTESALLDINDRLRAIEGSGGNYRRLVEHIFRAVHTVKANASLLGAQFIVHDADLFEGLLTTLRGREALTGDELIGVSVHLKQLFERLGWLRTVMARFATQVTSVAADTPDLAKALTSLARRVASDYSKTVNAEIQLDKLGSLEHKAASALQVIAAQLVRNAVAHGLEAPQERFEAGKQVAGRLSVVLAETGPSRYALSVRDDGRGIHAARIREALQRSGRYSPQALAELSDKQVLMEIFRPGFTTAEKSDEHAGRGVGMDVVAEAVRRIGGHLKLLTQPGAFTEFRVEFSA
ncbi:MAG: ATP-binding protein [Rhodocyclaceae bacterium]